MKFLLIFVGAIVFGTLGAIIGAIALSGTSVALPGLGLIIAGSLIGAVFGFIVGAIIGVIIGYIVSNKLAKSV